jgi:hypothetical protein
MATKKKDMPQEPEAESAALGDDDALDADVIEDDDLEVDLDDDEIEDIEEDPLDDDVDVAVLDEDDDEVDVEVAEILTASPAAVVERSGDAEDEEEEEEPDDEEATDQEDKTEGNERVLPKQPDEFVCRSCFLVKHPSQLADKKKMLCRDCV